MLVLVKVLTAIFGVVTIGLWILSGLCAVYALGMWQPGLFVLCLVVFLIVWAASIYVGEFLDEHFERADRRASDRKLARMGFFAFRARAEAEWDARRSIDRITDEYSREARKEADRIRRSGR
jgi:hypothetical protein